MVLVTAATATQETFLAFSARQLCQRRCRCRCPANFSPPRWLPRWHSQARCQWQSRPDVPNQILFHLCKSFLLYFFLFFVTRRVASIWNRFGSLTTTTLCLCWVLVASLAAFESCKRWRGIRIALRNANKSNQFFIPPELITVHYSLVFCFIHLIEQLHTSLCCSFMALE